MQGARASWQSGVWSEPQSRLTCPGPEVVADPASASTPGREREADDDETFYLS